MEITISSSFSVIVRSFAAAETFVDSAATVWLPQVYAFSFSYPWTPSDGLRPRIVSPWQRVCQFVS
jgi:hypothetical protein